MGETRQSPAIPSKSRWRRTAQANQLLLWLLLGTECVLVVLWLGSIWITLALVTPSCFTTVDFGSVLLSRDTSPLVMLPSTLRSTIGPA